jgi:hypothetical protein
MPRDLALEPGRVDAMQCEAAPASRMPGKDTHGPANSALGRGRGAGAGAEAGPPAL